MNKSQRDYCKANQKEKRSVGKHRLTKKPRILVLKGHIGECLVTKEWEDQCSKSAAVLIKVLQAYMVSTIK